MTDFRRRAKDQNCLVRLSGCQGNRMVSAVYRIGSEFEFSAPACRNCRDICSGDKKSGHDQAAIRLKHAEAALQATL